MDYSHELPLFQTTLLALSIASIIFLIFGRVRKKKPTAPEAGGAWPIIGHLHLLGGPQPPHVTLGNMADEIGPIFTVRLGVHRAIVVSSSDTARECLSTHDKVFANRPRSLAMEILGYNYGMTGFIPYGDCWRQARKIATVELLSNHRVEELNHVRESETGAAVREIHELLRNKSTTTTQNGVVALEMRNWFSNTTLNVIFRIIVGKRFAGATTEIEGDGDGRKALRVFFDFFGLFAVSDAFPRLRWMDIGGHEKEMKRIAKELDAMFDEWLEEHKHKRNNVCNGNKVDEDFMDIMLSLVEDGSKQLPICDLDNFNKATCLSLVLAGTDTSSVTLTWALSLLLNNREVLKKAQHELDTRVGRERQVQESDIPNLVYLQAILKETLRLYPATPLSVPHESMEDCTVQGYHVPAGTRLIVNLSKIQRDPRNWPDPSEFRPDRFMDLKGQNMDMRGQNFELIPFSSGRRICPGISLAIQVIQLTLAKLLHGFEIETPFGAQVDMGESLGLTNLKSTPLDVLLSPRLPSELYV